jgi:putative acetyltransferase
MRASIQPDVREERSGDASSIVDLHRRSFGSQGDAVSRLVQDLCATTPRGDQLSLVAAIEGRIVGHVLFTHNLLDAPSQLVGVHVLSPIAVDGAHRRRGVGSEMIRSGLRILAEDRVPAVFLEGDPAYYARFGFVTAGPAGFRKPSLRIPDLAFQVLKLPAFASWMSGTLVYREAFWRNDAVGLRDPDG